MLFRPVKNRRIWIGFFVILALLGVGVWAKQSGYISYKTSETVQDNESPDSKFIKELYSLIQERYWNDINDKDLSNTFLLASEKVLEADLSLEMDGKDSVASMIMSATENKDNRADLIAQIGDVVMINLTPFSRSRLFTQTQTETLVNTVINKDESANLYSLLNSNKDATKEELEKAYQDKIAIAKTDKDKAELERARLTLLEEGNRKAYDENKVEATVEGKALTKDIFYLKIKQFSPATLEEFVRVADSTKDAQYKSLILDLRNNIGGAVDILPYFLGPFIGPNSYAYDFYRKGEYIPYKTKTGWLESLVKFKKVVVLINGEAQSSAEVMAASLKKYNVGVLVGTKTKGWGTIEQISPLETQLGGKTYTAIIVQSLTVADDGQQIEGRGVEPHVDITDKNWKQKISEYNSDSKLISEIEKLFK